MSGSVARRSRITKPTTASAEIASGPSTTGVDQPHCWDCESPKTSPTRTMQSSTVPLMSGCWCSVRTRAAATCRSASRTAAIASGTLTSSTARHEKAEVSTPPMVGPSAPATAAAPPMVPSAQPRRSGGYVAPTIATVVGSISAPPTPCTTRAASSNEHPAAAEQVAEAAAEDEQAGEGQQARVEHPLGVLRPHVELLHDVRQRERDRGLVDQDHCVGQRHRGQDENEG